MNFLRDLISSFKQLPKPLKMLIVPAIIIAATLVVYASNNATIANYGGAVATEAEHGTTTSPASVVPDSSASGGSAVQFKPAPAPTPSPPTPSPNPTPTPAPTPPSQSDIPAGFPNASNTGVRPGTPLAIVIGNQTISQEGQVIENKDIRGCVYVRANNVIIRNSKVTCTVGSIGAVIRNYASNLLVEDTTIIGTNSGGTGLVGDVNDSSSTTGRRLDISGTADGIKLRSNTVLEYSYIHVQVSNPGEHADAMQTDSDPGAKNIVARFNTLVSYPGNAAYMYSGVGGALIEGNYMSSGSYATNGAGAVTFINNTFGRQGYGAYTNASGTTWIGNKYVDGTPVNYPR